MSVRVTYNEYSPTGESSAQKVVEYIKDELPDESTYIYVRSIPRAGTDDFITVEVPYFPMDDDGYTRASALVAKLEEKGLTARTVSDCD